MRNVVGSLLQIRHPSINISLWSWEEDSTKCIFLILFPARLILDSLSRALGRKSKVGQGGGLFLLCDCWSFDLHQQHFTTPARVNSLHWHATLEWLLVPASYTVLHSENQSPCSHLMVQAADRLYCLLRSVIPSWQRQLLKSLIFWES